jgi:hypothetical protein
MDRCRTRRAFRNDDCSKIVMLGLTKKELPGTLTPVISNIIQDTQLLLTQELALAKSELMEELSKAQESLLSTVIIGGAVALGTLLFAFGFVGFLHSIFQELALWECFALTAFIVEIGAAIFLILTRREEQQTPAFLPESKIHDFKRKQRG